MRILIQNKITQSRYEQVITIMKKRGAPIIECYVLSDDIYYALEGSHRVTAAKELGLTPILDVIAEINSEPDDDELYRAWIDSKARVTKGLFIDFNHQNTC